VDAPAGGIVGAQPGTIPVRIERQLVQRASGKRPIGGDVVPETRGALTVERLAQHLVVVPQVASGERRRLVLHGVGAEALRAGVGIQGGSPCGAVPNLAHGGPPRPHGFAGCPERRANRASATKRPRSGRGLDCVAAERLLDGGDVRGLRALRALGHFVLHPLAFLEAAKTLRIDRGEMCEHVRTAVLRGNEAKSLGVVEPLHGAVLHILDDLVVWVSSALPLRGSTPALYAN